ncbi:rhodanese-like domain-containing protein [Candidatus Regiella endosymbiont of Tuberolachnus salignus]|uniref:rhodanese-like domain-containing protein n=1 Tax=Candidatus Regiella endosymbiont of Tuberolachnus salignus TaxID=3077956 RepID=UPI0030CB21A7
MLQEITQFISQHPILSIAWITLFIIFIVSIFKSFFSNIKEITRAEAIHLINKENATVVDIRAPEDYRRGHILGAINLATKEIKNNNLQQLKKHKMRPIIVVCATGTTAISLAKNLNKAGFESVLVLKEGISGWSGENLPLVRGK